MVVKIILQQPFIEASLLLHYKSISEESFCCSTVVSPADEIQPNSSQADNSTMWVGGTVC